MSRQPNQPNLSSIPNAAGLAQKILLSLQEDKNDLSTLEQSLDNERNALEKNQHEQIASYAQQKSDLTKKIEQRHQQREALLKQHQVEYQPDSWLTVLQQLQEQTRLPVVAMWNEVESHLRECQKRLLINEKIVANLQNSVSQLLGAIRQASGTVETYSRSGRATAYVNNQSITSA